MKHLIVAEQGLLADNQWQGHLSNRPCSLIRQIRKQLAEQVPGLTEKFNRNLNYFGYRAPVDTSTDFTFQYEDHGLEEVPKSNTTANTRHDWSGTFDPVKTKTLRLTITAAAGDTARIFEVALYNTNGPPPR